MRRKVRFVQRPSVIGFQNRSRKNTTAAIKFLHDGKLGKVYMARGLCIKPRYNIGRFPDGPQAEGSKPVTIMSGTIGPYTKSYLDKVVYKPESDAAAAAAGLKAGDIQASTGAPCHMLHSANAL